MDRFMVIAVSFADGNAVDHADDKLVASLVFEPSQTGDAFAVAAVVVEVSIMLAVDLLILEGIMPRV